MKKKTAKPLIRRQFSDKNEVTLWFGDCLELLKQIPDASAQVVITSPPYNIGKSYERRLTLNRYVELQSKVIAECVRVLREGGSLCWQVGHHVNGHNQVVPLDLLLFPIFSSHEKRDKLRLRNRIVWHFEHGLNAKSRFSGRHETILWYTKGDSYIFHLDDVRVPQKYPGKRAYKGPRKGAFSGNPGGKNPGDVWILPNVKSKHIEKTGIHPCQFPIELPRRLIRALSNPGDLVVDPFIGVGTTAIAAVLEGRRAAGADKVKEYIVLARKRVRLAIKGLLPVRPNRPVFVPKPNSPLTTPPEHFMTARQSVN